MRKWFATEDLWAVWIGLGIVGLALAAPGGVDLLGWVVRTNEWLDISRAIAPVATSYNQLGGIGSLLVTYGFLAAILSLGAAVMGLPVRRFLPAFTVVFGISFVCWLAGHYAYIAATPDKRKAFQITWSLGLTGEAGYILALLVGLVISNFLPRFTFWLKDAARPEWFVKTAIVIMGAALGVKAASATGLATAILFRGLAAIIEAYLIYWALVYFIARKYFKFSREWAAPLASGISICGVSAAIATGAAIRARPIVPVMVSSLVVVFSVVEMLLLPFMAQSFLYMQPLVAAAWMGLAVKTDGAAASSGAITEALIRAKAETLGISYQEGWMLMTTTTVKVFIDLFIGIWAFVLALVWVYRINQKADDKVSFRDIWDRFPKFVLGYGLTFIVLLVLALNSTPQTFKALESATGEGDIFRRLFFVMTFFTIGLSSNFKKLWAEGIGRLALVYVVSLFGFVIWIGLLISWIFFHDVLPPTGGGI